jgi:hypothetical protein
MNLTFPQLEIITAQEERRVGKLETETETETAVAQAMILLVQNPTQYVRVSALPSRLTHSIAEPVVKPVVTRKLVSVASAVTSAAIPAKWLVVTLASTYRVIDSIAERAMRPAQTDNSASKVVAWLRVLRDFWLATMPA